MTVVARVAGPKIRVFNTDGTSNLITLDYLPFGHAGGGKAASAVTSVPAGWSEITFTNLIFDQEVDENPSIFDAGGINIAIFAYLIRSILGITPNTLNNNFYYQQERVTGVDRESTKDITGWIGGSIRQSQTSRYDPDITYWRITKLAFVQNGKWRVLQLNTAIAGTADSANIINTPTEHIYEGDNTFGAGVFGTAPTLYPGNTDDVEITSLNAQSSGMYIGVKGRGRRTFNRAGQGKPELDVSGNLDGWFLGDMYASRFRRLRKRIDIQAGFEVASTVDLYSVFWMFQCFYKDIIFDDNEPVFRTNVYMQVETITHINSPNYIWYLDTCPITREIVSGTKTGTYQRPTKIAFVKDDRWQVWKINREIAGDNTQEGYRRITLANAPRAFIKDETYGDGQFGTQAATVTENIEGYGLGRYTFEGRLVEVLNPGSDAGGVEAMGNTPASDPRPLYNICKRVYLLKHRSEAEAETKPIIVRKNTDGSLVPIDIDISSVLSDDINPLKRSNTVKWSDISHDRKSKIILSTFDTDPQIGDIKHASKLIVLSVGGGTPPVSGEFSKSSFINGTKTRNANELAFIDEVKKKIYLLNSSDDTWKDGSFDLYKKDKITTDISDSLRNEILSASRNHPLGEKYLKNGVATDNPLYAYDEYQGGVNNNLFPRYINNYSMAVEVGEFRSGVWRYEEDTFVFNAFKNSRDFQSDRSHNSSLYNKGRTIQFMYTPTFNASALRTISGGGPWRAITSKLSTSNRHELLAYNSDGMIDWFRWTGTSVEKARTLPLKGFNLQYVTGIEWIGNNLYVCDSGQRDNQIQKFSISTTDIQFVKTINNPVRADSLTLAQLCRVIEQQTTTTEEVCTKIPGGSRNVSSDWYSGILPIDELPVGISGRNLSLRIKINHNQYLDIGTLFLESSRPRTLK